VPVSVPNNPIESPIPSRLPWQHNRIQSIGSDSIAIVDCNLPIATLTGVEDRGGGAASLCQDSALFITARINVSKTKLEQCYIYKDTKLRRRRRKIIRGSIG